MALSPSEIEKAANDHYDDVYKFCVSRVSSREDAQDITQDTFLLLLEKSKELIDADLRAWLYCTAGLKIREYLRKKKIEGSFVPYDAAELADLQSGESPMTEEEFEKLLTKAQKKILSVLSEGEKELFIKLYIEKKSVRVVSDETGLTEGSVYVKAYRARKKAKKAISTMDLMINIIIFKLHL